MPGANTTQTASPDPNLEKNNNSLSRVVTLNIAANNIHNIEPLNMERMLDTNDFEVLTRSSSTGILLKVP